jgi:hypothetical protein
MRALCGAIITAGALMGLGLAEIGYGLRYQQFTKKNEDTGYQWGAPTMSTILVVLLIMVGVGIATAFIGLAFHHYRRYHEFLREHGQAPERARV